MTARIVRSLTVAALAAGLLGACAADTGEILGLDKRTPDEFAVVQRAPLTLPPNFGLRPPDPDGQSNQDLQPRATAQEALFGRDASRRLEQQKEALRDQGATQGEIALLERTGALEADSSIRRVVEEESASLAQEQESFIDDLVFWREKEQPGDIVDADGEQRRLQENAALGRDPTEGQTPLIRRDSERPTFEWPF
ncbi:MAG: DUF3035 domain-containing protein [Marivibrio sp.]|uniref:DUF3035 domain-containing protein n=1 Tax=Marivibrio sp. TaxID=2039719 RepID=UPI0032EC9793